MTSISVGIQVFVIIVVLSVTPRTSTGSRVALLFPMLTVALRGGIALAADGGFRRALRRGTFMRVSRTLHAVSP